MGTAAASNPRRTRAIAPVIVWMVLPAIVIFGAVYLVPLAKLVSASFIRDGALTLSNHLDLIGSASFRAIVVRTFKMAVVVTFFTLLLGYPAAYFLSRLAPRRAALLLLVVTVPYLTSILIRSYAWIVLLGPAGLINKSLLWLGILDEPVRLVFNLTGAYIGMVQIQLPLMIFALYAPMQRIDRTLLNAAQSLGGNRASAFFQVFLPLSLPGVLGGSMLVFLSTLGFYVTPALLGGTGDYMIAQAIQVRVSNLADYDAASAQGTLLLLVVVLAFVLLRRRLTDGLSESGAPAATGPHAGDGLRTERMPEAVTHRLHSVFGALSEVLTWLRLPALYLAMAFCLLYLVAPMVVVVVLAFSDAAYLTFPPPDYSLRWFWAFFSDQRWLSALWFSIWCAGLAAVLSTLIAAPAAFALVRRRFPGRLTLYLLLISPLVVPRIIIGVALLFAFVPMGISGTPIGFILAYALVGTPFVVVLFVTGLRRFDRDLEMAAAGLGATPARVLSTVTLPLLVPTIVSALLFAFIAGFDDVELGLFISGPQATPLPIRMLENIRLEISPQIAVIGTLLFAALIAGFALHLVVSRLLRSFAKRWSLPAHSSGRVQNEAPSHEP